MEIPGLLFGKIDEDWAAFSNGLQSASLEKFISVSKDEKIRLFEKNVLDDSLKKLLENYSKLIEIHAKNQQVVSGGMELSFAHFFAYLYSAGTVFENIREHKKKNQTTDTHKLLVPLYGKLVRIAEQIGVLLTNGYPDGAWRIWRSFYEETAILLFLIKERGKVDLEGKYIDHFNRTKKRKADSMQKNHQELKFPPIDADLLLNLDEKIKEFETKYGKEFLDEEFGWAKSVFNMSRKITFRDIEDHVRISRYRPFYIWASEHSHATFGSMIQFLDGNKINLSSIVRQATDKTSLIDPMQFTISLFHEANLEFLKVYSGNNEYEINMLMFRRIFEGLIGSFG